jgi:hypothetical protein
MCWSFQGSKLKTRASTSVGRAVACAAAAAAAADRVTRRCWSGGVMCCSRAVGVQRPAACMKAAGLSVCRGDERCGRRAAAAGECNLHAVSNHIRSACRPACPAPPRHHPPVTGTATRRLWGQARGGVRWLGWPRARAIRGGVDYAKNEPMSMLLSATKMCAAGGKHFDCADCIGSRPAAARAGGSRGGGAPHRWAAAEPTHPRAQAGKPQAAQQQHCRSRRAQWQCSPPARIARWRANLALARPSLPLAPGQALLPAKQAP